MADDRGTGKRPRRRASFVVGLGGSAGSLDALEQFFANAPVEAGVAYVVVALLEPAAEALLPDRLRRATVMEVQEARTGLRLSGNAVYVIPPDRELSIDGDVLRIRAASRRPVARTSIDQFFRSLAHERGPQAFGVVLSGAGTDGARGLLGITEAGGAALVQAPETAAFDAMPRAAIAAVPAAVVAPPGELPARIVALLGDHALEAGP